jgi:hypothetical protein
MTSHSKILGSPAAKRMGARPTSSELGQWICATARSDLLPVRGTLRRSNWQYGNDIRSALVAVGDRKVYSIQSSQRPCTEMSSAHTSTGAGRPLRSSS